MWVPRRSRTRSKSENRPPQERRGSLASRDELEFGLMFELPPGETLRVDEKAWLQLPLWIYWLRIAW
jgi:hypothetical protein